MPTAASDRPSRFKNAPERPSLPAHKMDAPSSVAKPTRVMDAPSSAIKPPAKKKLAGRAGTAVAAAILKFETPSRRSSSFVSPTPDKESEEMLGKPVAVADEECIVEAIRS